MKIQNFNDSMNTRDSELNGPPARKMLTSQIQSSRALSPPLDSLFRKRQRKRSTHNVPTDFYRQRGYREREPEAYLGTHLVSDSPISDRKDEIPSQETHACLAAGTSPDQHGFAFPSYLMQNHDFWNRL